MATTVTERPLPHAEEPVLPPLEVQEPGLIERIDEAWNIVIAKYGDTYIDRAEYNAFVINDHPSCVVGAVLHQAGVPIEVLRQEAAIISIIRRDFADAPPAHQQRVSTALSAALHQNDKGSSWGLCRKTYQYALGAQNQ